jgi:hypothetical protein
MWNDDGKIYRYKYYTFLLLRESSGSTVQFSSQIVYDDVANARIVRTNCRTNRKSIWKSSRLPNGRVPSCFSGNGTNCTEFFYMYKFGISHLEVDLTSGSWYNRDSRLPYGRYLPVLVVKSPFRTLVRVRVQVWYTTYHDFLTSHPHTNRHSHLINFEKQCVQGKNINDWWAIILVEHKQKSKSNLKCNSITFIS